MLLFVFIAYSFIEEMFFILDEHLLARFSLLCQHVDLQFAFWCALVTVRADPYQFCRFAFTVLRWSARPPVTFSAVRNVLPFERDRSASAGCATAFHTCRPSTPRYH